MKYINGTTLADYLHDVEISSIHKIVERFMEIVPESYEYDINAKHKFHKKLSDLKKNIDLKDHSNLKKVFRHLEEYEWKHCIASDCHGDLTLENIVWVDGELYLLDFLDSFYNSWMIDFAKIFQDIECYWSYRHKEVLGENLRIRLVILKQLVIDRILTLKDGDKLLYSIYCILLINLVRIVPYSNDELTKVYLAREIEKIYKKLTTNSI